MIKSREKVEQGRLARAGRAQQSQKFAGGDVDGDAIHGANGGFAHAVLAHQLIGANGRAVKFGRFSHKAPAELR